MAVLLSHLQVLNSFLFLYGHPLPSFLSPRFSFHHSDTRASFLILIAYFSSRFTLRTFLFDFDFCSFDFPTFFTAIGRPGQMPIIDSKCRLPA